MNQWESISRIVRIWGVPTLTVGAIVICMMVVFSGSLSLGTDVEQEVDTFAETALAFGLICCLIVAIWANVRRHERLEGKPVRRRLKTLLLVFTILLGVPWVIYFAIACIVQMVR